MTGEAENVKTVPRWRDMTANVLAAATVIAVIVAMPFLLLPLEHLLTLFTSLLLAFVFLKYPLRVKAIGFWVDMGATILALGMAYYRIANFQALIFERPGLVLPMDIFWAVVAVVLTLEAVRRTSGLGLVVIAGVFLGYSFAGPYLPGLLTHRGYGLERLADQMYLTDQGIYGLPVKVLVQYVLLFVAFGSVLEASGGSEFLIDLARSVAGHVTGGIAKVAMVASGLMGMISGSAVANVATTGCITIPAMKKSGYEPHVAGAVEAVASTGGQIMPPVMAAAAFLMADFLQVPYLEVVKVALVPAIMYYLAGMMAVHFYAMDRGLKGEPRESLPGLKTVILKQGYYMIPIVVLIAMLVSGYSPTMAGLSGLVAGIVVSFLNRDRNKWMTPARLWGAMVDSGKSMGLLVATSATAGIVVGVINITGLGPRISSLLIDLSGGSLVLLLLLTALTSLIMGMGMPTTVVYLVLATLVAPALTGMGANVMVSHLFILYFGILSMITPPVALAAYAGAAIAGADANKVGWTAMRLALPAFLIPFAFVMSPSLALQGSLLDAARPVLTTTVGVIFLSAGTMGHFFFGRMNSLQRVAFIVSAVMLIDPGGFTDLIGLAVGVANAAWIYLGKGNGRAVSD